MVYVQFLVFQILINGVPSNLQPNERNMIRRSSIAFHIFVMCWRLFWDDTTLCSTKNLARNLHRIGCPLVITFAVHGWQPIFLDATVESTHTTVDMLNRYENCLGQRSTVKKIHHLFCQTYPPPQKNSNITITSHAFCGIDGWEIPWHLMLDWKIQEANLWLH